VIKQQFPENILNFIVSYLVPAKSNIEAGFFIRNDILDDKKYAWKKPVAETIDRGASVEQSIIYDGTMIVDQSSVLYKAAQETVSDQLHVADTISNYPSSNAEVFDDNANHVHQPSLVPTIIHDEVIKRQPLTTTSPLISQISTSITSVKTTFVTYQYENKYMDQLI